MNLFELRKQFNLSQMEAASILSIPARTYIRYEKDDSYGSNLKRDAMIRTLIDKCEISETKGILSIEDIKDQISALIDAEYKGKVDFCYLFGSYAKGYAKENSDVDLCIATSLTGLDFVGLSERMHNTLHKNIDLVRFSNLEKNLTLINEIMKDGIKIYKL